VTSRFEHSDLVATADLFERFALPGSMVVHVERLHPDTSMEEVRVAYRMGPRAMEEGTLHKRKVSWAELEEWRVLSRDLERHNIIHGAGKALGIRTRELARQLGIPETEMRELRRAPNAGLGDFECADRLVALINQKLARLMHARDRLATFLATRRQGHG